MKNAVISNTGAPSAEELELINSMTRRPFNQDELYVFSVTLCDNDIDRDFERFTVNALEELAKMYVGKPGIFDHSMKGKDQVARIFSCKVEAPAGVFTKDSLPYYCLRARAYMPRTAKNEELIVDIDAGINKEVSVGCAMETAVCSVCGIDRRIGCSHKNGRHYKKDGKKVVCHTILDNPKDAFEWSFVAVPAQPKAGVTKAFSKDSGAFSLENGFSEVAKALGFGGNDDVDTITAEICRIKALAQQGERYVEEIKGRTLNEFCALYGDLSANIIKSALDGMSETDLFKFYDEIHRRACLKALPRPQTAPKAAAPDESRNNQKFIV